MTTIIPLGIKDERHEFIYILHCTQCKKWWKKEKKFSKFHSSAYDTYANGFSVSWCGFKVHNLLNYFLFYIVAYRDTRIKWRKLSEHYWVFILNLCFSCECVFGHQIFYFDSILNDQLQMLWFSRCFSFFFWLVNEFMQVDCTGEKWNTE